MVGSVKQDSLRSRILATLEKSYDKILLTDDYVTWTGQEILAKMKRLRELIEATTRPGASIAVSFPNLAVQALAILTVIISGRIPIILSFTDMGADLEQRLQMAQASMLLTMTGVEDLSSLVIPFAVLSADATVKAAVTNSVRNSRFKDEPHPASKKAALMLFTSGSTGKPKGVYVPELGLLKTIDFLTKYFGVTSKTVSPIVLPIWHSMALNTQFLPTFLAGGRSYFMNAWLSIGRVYRSILFKEGTFVSLIGEVLRVCWEEKDRKNLPPAEKVEHVQLAGGMISEKHLRLARELFPNAVLHKGYGLTEAIRVTMINSNEPDFTTGAVGRPLPFVDVEIRNRGAGKIERPGVVGEVFVRGDNVLAGTAGSYESPVGPDGFLATGDLGYWNDNGSLCIAGRNDGLFKINGHRVSGFEIEQMALETSDLIRNAKCIAVEDSRRAGYKIVLLLEVPADVQSEFLNSEFDDIPEKIWKKFQTLAHFPKEIMVLEKFPRNANGKVALAKLKETYLQSRQAALLESSHSRLQFFRLRTTELKGRVEA